MILLLLVYLFHIIDSIKVGYVSQRYVKTNTNFIVSSSLTCSDCLCDCITDGMKSSSVASKCYGINCFPLNSSCQRIEQPWVTETDLMDDSTFSSFVKTVGLNFCSCYSTQNMLNGFANVTPTFTAHSMARYLTYDMYNHMLIVLGDSLIGRYYVSNLTRIQSLSTTSIPLAVCLDNLNIYISFASNASVNKYDTKLRYIQSIGRPSLYTRSTYLYGLTKWKNLVFVSDKTYSYVWFFNETSSQMSIYLNMSAYGFSPCSIAVFNDVLYISEFFSSVVYMYDMIHSIIRSVSFSTSISLYRSQKDIFCNRIWFGNSDNNFTSVPVLDLSTLQPSVFQSEGILAQKSSYKIDFDSSYSLYTVAKDGTGFYKYSLPNLPCKY